jgi:hypothetical protein
MSDERQNMHELRWKLGSDGMRDGSFVGFLNRHQAMRTSRRASESMTRRSLFPSPPRTWMTLRPRSMSPTFRPVTSDTRSRAP